MELFGLPVVKVDKKIGDITKIKVGEAIDLFSEVDPQPFVDFSEAASEAGATVESVLSEWRKRREGMGF